MINCITISPKYGDIESITKFIKNGCNMFRLNFSWGTHAEYASIIKNIRQASQDQETPILILQDLQGPKLRVQNLDTEIHVKPTDILKASFDKQSNHIQLQAKGLYQKNSIGKKLLIKDGDIIFTIKEVQTDKQIITLESQSHGSFKNMNGCNAPSIELGLEAISTKDKQDIQFAIDQQIDIISLSFIHNANDLIELAI